jgi:hypothetical protein
MDKREIKQEIEKSAKEVTVVTQMGNHENCTKTQLLGLDRSRQN